MGGVGAISSNRGSTSFSPQDLQSPLLKPAYRIMLSAQDRDSDSSGTRLRNKCLRKKARKEVRKGRSMMKEEDPFLYYFGKIDKDKI